MNSTFAAHLAQFLPLVGLLIGIAALGIGSAAAFFPSFACEGYGIKTSGSGLSFVRATGARDIFIGCLFIFAYVEADLRLTAFLSFFTAVVSGADFLITRKDGTRLFSYFHLSATVLIITYGVLIYRM